MRILCFSLHDMSKPVCVREIIDMNTVRISISKSEKQLIKRAENSPVNSLALSLYAQATK